MVATRTWTRAEVLALPDDGQRYELIDGELLVSPGPRRAHQRAIRELFLHVHGYVSAHAFGETLFSPADLDLRARQLVQPDLFVVGRAQTAGPHEWDAVGIPLLIVEVLSPSTAEYDRVKKRKLYQRVGVPVYWIVDLDARVVEEWTPAADRPRVVDDILTWQPDPAVPALQIALATYFGQVWGAGSEKREGRSEM